MPLIVQVFDNALQLQRMQMSDAELRRYRIIRWALLDGAKPSWQA